MMGIRKLGSFHGRSVFELSEPIPMMGHVAFGVLDRGTNVIQVRPTTICQHSCIFCSVDAGPMSRFRRSEFIVDVEWLAHWVVEVARLKGGGIEVLLDGVGEPLTHPRVDLLIRLVKESGYVSRVAAETHGGGLSRELIERLWRAGLDRINLSIDAVSRDLAAKLVGADWYDPDEVLRLAEWVLKNTGVDVVLTPVVVPGYNESEVRALIEWARKHGAGSKSGWPTGVLPQKYEVHKYGRKVRGVRAWSWRTFYSWLRKLEKEAGYRLVVESWEIGMERRPRVAQPYGIGKRVRATVIGPGWHLNEVLVVDRKWLRVMTLLGVGDLDLGTQVEVVIRENQDNIYVVELAEALRP